MKCEPIFAVKKSNYFLILSSISTAYCDIIGELGRL